MNKQLLSFLLTLLMSMVGTKSFAHDFAVANDDGVTIYYKKKINSKEVAVSYRGSNYYNYQNTYSGNVVIPASVEYKGTIYSVTSIDGYAFSSCIGLTSVAIPSTVTSIGEYAFGGCGLTSITIPQSVTYIGRNPFSASSLNSIVVEDNNTFYDSRNNCNAIINTKTNELITGCNKTIIPNNVTSIGESAFSGCSNLTSIDIPNSVTGIGGGAFYSCSGLTSITIPNNVITIGDGAFRDCSNLTSIEIPNSVTNIGKEVFYGCSGLTSATVLCSPASIGSNVFANCNNIREVTFDCETVTSLFKELSSIEIINLSNNAKNIDQSAFYKCSGLTNLTIPNSITSIGQNAFSDCSGLTNITIGNGVNTIEDRAFYGCSMLKTIIISCSPTNLGQNIFEGCNNIIEAVFECETVTSLLKEKTSLLKVTIKEGATKIGNEAFNGCSGLISIIIPNSVTSIGSYAFQYCTGLNSVTIPNSITTIGSYAFYRCRSIISVIIGSGVTSIGEYAFRGTNLKKTIWLTNTPPTGYINASGAVNYVSNDNFVSLENTIKYTFLSSFFDVDCIRYVPVNPSERTCDAIDCLYDESASDTKISSTVVYKGVTLNVKSIKPYLAHSNRYIKSLTVDIDGEIPQYAFTNCSNMNAVKLGKKVSAIGDYVFQGCSSFETIDIPEIVTQLNYSSFSNCTSLKEIKIKSKITNIQNYVFDNCTSLKKVLIEDSENDLNLGSNDSSPIFSSCPLDYVYIGRNINYNKTSSYGYSPFYRNTSLRAVEITNKETEISDNEFYGCTNLQRVTIGDGITTIGNFAFSGCQSLQYFAFGSQVATIGQEAFSDCAAVTEIISKATTPPVCGSQALDDINKWECKLYIPDGCMATYTSADQWKDFFFAEEGTGTAEQNPEGQPTTGKCEKPTISLVDGKIHFACATEGVSYTYHVTATNPSGVGNDINPSSLKLTVYASKPGFETSDAATIEFAAPSGLKGDLNEDGTVNVADHVELTKIIMDQE